MSSFDLTFLGTCACDFSKKLDGECRDRFDLDARRASCALLDGHILIDCGPHCPDSMRIAGVSAADVTDVLITHFHSDHYNPDNIAKISAAKDSPLRLWVSSEAVLPDIPNVDVVRMDKLCLYDVGDGLTVTGLYANHDTAYFPQHFLFEREGKRLLYALDGAWFMTASYNYLRSVGTLSLMVIDATCGDYVGDWRMAEHNSIPMIRMMLPSLRAAGIIDGESRIYLSHLAPSLHKPHTETVKTVTPDGLDVAYDGLQITV